MVEVGLLPSTTTTGTHIWSEVEDARRFDGRELARMVVGIHRDDVGTPLGTHETNKVLRVGAVRLRLGHIPKLAGFQGQLRILHPEPHQG